MSLSHQTQVLTYLKTGKTLTVIEAGQKFKCHSLTGVISRLRKQGYDIKTHAEPNLNSKGTHARYELNEVEA
ncbi:helix-turn-helix domain-containing protein [Acinetobacter rathckeae]|uniref:helix-turn-helix domain-containing protein n=1 Tax=Acinetobacter rathckeae TaxID=2605272 RepID=UPI0018A2B0FB|nr:helix-turn-helix domain-containing protein [Acinetobacter rathckeae]MBF7695859.1 DNA-binding protein [Acinetobacter rathckeae]